VVVYCLSDYGLKFTDNNGVFIASTSEKILPSQQSINKSVDKQINLITILR
jgi:hypothetical protein